MNNGLTTLRARLRNANLAEVARRAGVSAPAVRNIAIGKAGNPGILTVAAIRHALNMIDDDKTGGSAKKASAPTPRAARRRTASKAAVPIPTAAGMRRPKTGGLKAGGKRTGTNVETTGVPVHTRAGAVRAHAAVPVRKVAATAKRGRKAA